MFTKIENIYLTFLVVIMTFIIMVCPILAACGVFRNDSETEAGNYALTAVVTKTDRVADTVTIEDAAGNEWQFYGVEDWEVGDGASAIMCDNGTQEIFDDSIVSVRYNSWNLLGE